MKIRRDPPIQLSRGPVLDESPEPPFRMIEAPRPPIRQWTVQDPHWASPAVFENAAMAWEHASAVCEAGAPAVVRHPEGGVFYVFREDTAVEVSTRHRCVGTTRRVVEP